MPRYKGLDSRTKWRYLGIQEDGFDPMAQGDIRKMVERSRKNIELGQTVTLSVLRKREELGLPKPISSLVYPPNGDKRNNLPKKFQKNG